MHIPRSVSCLFLFFTFATAATAQEIGRKSDFYGDPLPAGAIARMGTTRLRHGKSVLDYVLSPDGKRITSFGAEGLLMDWNAENGKNLRRQMLEHGPFTSAAFSADRNLLATIGDEGSETRSTKLSDKANRTVRLWDVATGKESKKLTDSAGTVGGIAFAPDGKTLATMSQGYLIHLWEIPSGKLLRRLDGESNLEWRALFAFSPDSQTLASSGDDGKIRIWEVRTGNNLREIKVPNIDRATQFGRSNRVVRVVFSPDGKSLACGCADHGVFVWDANNGTEVRRFSEHGYWSSAITFTPDSKGLVFKHKERDLRQWDIKTGQEVRRFREGGQPAFSADGKTLAWVSGNSILPWDVQLARERFQMAAHEWKIDALALSADDKILATLGIDGMRQWDVATGKPRGTVFGPRQLSTMAISPDGKMIAASGFKKLISLWDPVTGKEIHQLPSDKTMTTHLSFRPDGTLLNIGFDGSLRFSDVHTGASTIFMERGFYFAIVLLSPDGKRLAATGMSKTLDLWDVAAGTQLWRAPVIEGIGRSLAYSADGNWVALADGTDRYPYNSKAEQSIHLYLATNGKKIRQFGKGFGPFHAVAFSPDGRTVATGGEDGVVRLWETISGQERLRFAGHAAAIRALAFPKKDAALISGSDDGTALVWSLAVQPPPRDLTAAELDAAWADLAKDAGKANDAWGTLAAAPKLTTKFLAKKIQPAKAIAAERLASLLAALRSEKLAERDKAAKELEGLGDLAGPALRKAIASNLPLEHKRRIDLILGKLPAPLTVEQLRNLRAVEVLENVGNAEDQQILTTLANGAPGARLTQESQAALDRLAKKAKTP